MNPNLISKLEKMIEKWHSKWVDNKDGLFTQDYKDLALTISKMVGVKMPKKRKIEHSELPNSRDLISEGWNAYRDEFLRLNPRLEGVR